MNHTLNILYVEDDPAHAFLAMMHFKKSRIRNSIVHVEDGEEALEYMYLRGKYSNIQTAPRPDVILLDLRLPKVDGLKVLETIKTDEFLKLIPVVIFTSSDAESDKLQAYAYHANSYLVKPAESKKFSEMVDTFGSYWSEWNKNSEHAKNPAQSFK
jgi:CheY-like chemotaxis protein